MCETNFWLRSCLCFKNSHCESYSEVKYFNYFPYSYKHGLHLLQLLTFMGSCIINIFQYVSNKMQLYTVYLYLETALHVSSGTSTHHQDRKQPYLQHLVFVTPVLLPATIVAGSSNGVTNTRCCWYGCMRFWW
jgi:hypothetical protein